MPFARRDLDSRVHRSSRNPRFALSNRIARTCARHDQGVRVVLCEVESGPELVVCSTCRFTPETRENADGERGGAVLAQHLRAVQEETPELAGVAVREMPCLFACQRHCVVHLRAPGKVGYVLGDFTPDADAARAILEYALAHGASEEGVVRYAQWPQGVKGHFITRVPPQGYLCT